MLDALLRIRTAILLELLFHLSVFFFSFFVVLDRIVTRPLFDVSVSTFNVQVNFQVLIKHPSQVHFCILPPSVPNLLQQLNSPTPIFYPCVAFRHPSQRCHDNGFKQESVAAALRPQRSATSPTRQTTNYPFEPAPRLRPHPTQRH